MTISWKDSIVEEYVRRNNLNQILMRSQIPLTRTDIDETNYLSEALTYILSPNSDNSNKTTKKN